MAVPGDRRVQDGLRDHGLGDEARHGAGDEAAVGRTQARDVGRRRQRVERGDAEQRPLHELELVGAGLAEALHAEERNLEARRLGGEAGADVASAVAVRDGHAVGRPVAREGLDGAGGHAADLLGPLGRLRHAVLAAEHVVAEVVEADRMRVEVLLVVGVLGDPRVGDGELEGRIGVGQDGDPLVGVDGVGVVHVGRDVDLLHADLGEPEAQAARHHAAPAKRRGLGVAAPEQHGVAVLGNVFDDVVLAVLLAERVHAPDVLGAPVPAFPAVGLARLQREAAEQVQKVRHAAVGGMDDLRLAVAVDLGEHGVGAVGLDDALELGGDELGRLVPADAFVLAHAAGLRMALAGRIPVDALERIGDAVLRVDALLVHERQRRDERLETRLEGVPARLDLPVVEIFGGVVLVEVERTDAQDLVVFLVDVDRAGVGAQAEAVEPEAFDDRCSFNVRCHVRVLSSRC